MGVEREREHDGVRPGSSARARHAVTVLATLLLVWQSAREAFAGGARFTDTAVSYDRETGTVQACASLEFYFYGRQHERPVLLFEISAEGHKHLYVWMPSSEPRPCIAFPLKRGLLGSLEVAYYADPAIVASADSFAGVQPLELASPKVKTAVHQINRSSWQRVGKSKDDLLSTASLYLRLNGKTPGQELTVPTGVSSVPLVFSWLMRGLPNGANVEYRYRLYPTQLEWSSWGRNTEATLTYIPAGIHVFQVEASIAFAGRRVSPPPAKYDFTLEHPFVGPATTKSSTGTSAQLQRITNYTAKRALLIGVTKYNNPQFPDLGFVQNDIKAVESALRKHGFKSIELDGRSPTSQVITQKVTAFLNAAAQDEQTVVYLSGHGFAPMDSEEDRAYFAGSDCNRNNTATCVSLSNLKEVMSDAVARARGPRHVLLIIDACAAGKMVVAKGFTMELAAAAGRTAQVVSAGTRGEDAIEDQSKQLSIFTRYLVEGLAGGADMITDKVMPLSELMVWVRWKVAKETGGRQTPSFTRIKGSGEMMFEVPRP